MYAVPKAFVNQEKRLNMTEMICAPLLLEEIHFAAHKQSSNYSSIKKDTSTAVNPYLSKLSNLGFVEAMGVFVGFR